MRTGAHRLSVACSLISSVPTQEVARDAARNPLVDRTLAVDARLLPQALLAHLI
jgi:hypothetical protein